jgi:hypothetical protein
MQLVDKFYAMFIAFTAVELISMPSLSTIFSYAAMK